METKLITKAGDCDLAIPYWASDLSDDFLNTNVTRNDRFGSTGAHGVPECIDTASAFSQIAPQPSTPSFPTSSCMERVWNINSRSSDAIKVQANLLVQNTTWAEWVVQLERVHNIVHGVIGGTMATGWSPLDPLFYTHHANIDRMWHYKQSNKTWENWGDNTRYNPPTATGFRQDILWGLAGGNAKFNNTDEWAMEKLLEKLKIAEQDGSGPLAVEKIRHDISDKKKITRVLTLDDVDDSSALKPNPYDDEESVWAVEYVVPQKTAISQAYIDTRDFRDLAFVDATQVDEELSEEIERLSRLATEFKLGHMDPTFLTSLLAAVGAQADTASLASSASPAP